MFGGPVNRTAAVTFARVPPGQLINYSAARHRLHSTTLHSTDFFSKLVPRECFSVVGGRGQCLGGTEERSMAVGALGPCPHCPCYYCDQSLFRKYDVFCARYLPKAHHHLHPTNLFRCLIHQMRKILDALFRVPQALLRHQTKSSPSFQWLGGFVGWLNQPHPCGASPTSLL